MNAPSTQPGNRVLIIDDNASIHADFRKILGQDQDQNVELNRAKARLFGESSIITPQAGFVIDSAFQGREGLEMVKRAAAEGHPFALAFVDVRMPPGWDGIETISHIWKCCPEIQVVVCTAYSDYSWEEMIHKLGHSPDLVVLKKPFDNIEVLQLAHALTKKWHLNREVQSRLNNLDALVRQRTSELETANEQLKCEIAKQLKLESQLRHSQKMEAVGQLAAGVAHDFNNILTVIEGNAALLQDQLGRDPVCAEPLNDISVAAERAARLVRQLLAFSRKQVLKSEKLNLGEVINNLREMLKRLLGDHITLEVNVAPELPPIQADLSMMEQIIMNLSVNARDAMPKGGKLAVGIEAVVITNEDAQKNSEIRPGRHVCLSLSDTGGGIAPELLPRIFDPFFTTKEIGKGTGLGLATVYGVVKQHNGWVEVQSTVNQGTAFRIYLPVYTGNSRPGDSSPSRKPAAKNGTECILVVEDEDHLRALTATVLRKNGYRVLEATSGLDALKVFQGHSSEIDLLFTDVMMPGNLLGDELAARLCSTKPSLAVLFTSGYTPEVTKTDFRGNGNFLSKPFTPVQMLAQIRQCLDHAPVEKSKAQV
ncbi:MAG TPA: response regulator [Verrucomicrobiae bacterium]|nr:response regulator [Verrucomicrobiae bacterium]